MTATLDTAAPFLRQILLDPQGWEHTPPVFCDWLEERGDPRGPLLRRRWRMAVKLINKCESRKLAWRAMPGVLGNFDALINAEVRRIRWYVVRKFDVKVQRRPGQRGIKYEFHDAEAA